MGCAASTYNVWERNEAGEWIHTKKERIISAGGSAKYAKDKAELESTLRIPDINVLSGLIPQ